MRLRSVIAACAGPLLVAGLVVAPPGQRPARAATQSGIVSANPVDFTPNLLDGDVRSIVQIGDRIFIGGNFTQVEEAGSSTVVTRDRVLAFDATTGKLDDSFKPSVDSEVSVLLPAPDGKSIYLGGMFKTIDGVAHKSLARLDVNTGAAIPGFDPRLDAKVQDLRLAGGRLWAAGNFALVNGVSRPALATLNPDTGARDDYQSLTFAGTQNGGVTHVKKIDVTPDGSKLVAVGNFTTVDGQSRPQIVMLDLTGSSARLADWQTSRYGAACSSSFDSYMRDLDFSPDGSFFVVSTTGAAGGTSKLCDAQARWETNATGANLQPTWVTYTGGDTTYAVEITNTAVYVGGHFRWSNNPFGSDSPGQGAVDRQGIAALDPASGMPFQWNPGRTRGVGVFDLLATTQGLWMGSDTDETGGETHQKLAMFPVTGGTTIPAWSTGSLPGNVYYGGATDSLQHRSFDGATAGTAVADDTGGIDWTSVRGAFMINGDLYTGAADGGLYRRSYDGRTFGSATAVDGADQITPETTWHGQVPSIQGMFYSGGRIYYTRGTSALYYRGFNPESGVVGALETTASGNLTGLDWSTVGGMFTAGGKLYYVSTTDGKLRAVGFTGGVPSGTPAVVDGGDWRGRALFLYAGVPNDPPKAAFSANCDQLTCTVDGSGSSDSDGSIAAYAWDFGDGTTATGATAGHTYTAAGTYTIKLTVTDDRGGTGTLSQQVQVAPTSTGIGFRGTDGFNANTTSATVHVPSGVQAGDGMLLLLTMNNPSLTITPPSGWQQVDTQTNGVATSTVWQRVAAAGDAGSAVSVGISDYAKADLRLLAYQGTDQTAPVAAVAKAADPATTTTHTTPTVNVPAAGDWLVSYWSDKSGTTTAWTAPDGVTTRGTSIGTGSGRVTSLAADSDGTVATGGRGGLTATTDAASRGFEWSLVLAPKQ